ncbi:MAG: TonB-dependent receptor [Gammaproteobacteria bacterium]|nr:MAG: TonB-dependent receptor [Gammaproteobacteria bacterium]RLA54339.1 MAG: TonB-dependent receptor [Gammaproteobacteria bacterium]
MQQDQTSVINEVTIQGSRTGQSASSWPGSVYTVSEEVLNLVRPRHITEVLVRTPGVWISRGNGQEHLTALRSPVLTGAGACGAFLMAEDNIPLRAAGFCNVNQLLESTSELAERIEVLPGPQSVLYGTNALHGMINVISPSPPTSTNQPPLTTLALEAGSYDHYRTRFISTGRADGSIGRSGDSWYMGFDGVNDNGYKDDAGFDQQKAKFRYDANFGDIQATTIAAYTNLNQETAGFIRGDDAYKDGSHKRENPNPDAYRDVRSWRLHTRFEYPVDAATLWLFTPYTRHTETEFRMHFLPWQPVEKNKHYSFGWQSALQHRLTEQLDIDLGVDGEYTHGKLQETQSDGFSPSIPAGVHYDYKVDARVVSPFVALRWQINEAAQLSVGARYEWLHYDYDNKAPGLSPCMTGVDCRFTRPDDSIDNFNNPSWQLGGIYEFMPGHSLFVNFARGYRAPQTTELYRLQAGQQETDLDAETLDNIELGLRGEIPGLQYSIAAYQMDKDHVIFQDTNRQNISGAKTSHRGIELAASWAPAAEWYVDINASYAKHTYDSDIAISETPIKNNDIDTAPRYTGSAQVGKYFANNSRVELEWIYLGSYYTDPENEHSYRGHRLFNLRWQWQATKAWQFGLRLNNLLDEDYADRADFGFGQDRYFVGEPRTGFIEITRQL